MISKAVQSNVNGRILIKPHYELVKFTDGDDLIVKNIFSQQEINIRLLGIDAPETKRTKKLSKDEKDLQIPSQLLQQLGYKTLKFLTEKFKHKTKITLIQECNNLKDRYGRNLAYVQFENGSILNETLIAEGYAKPYNKVFCIELAKYQALNLIAKQKKLGLYKSVKSF